MRYKIFAVFAFVVLTLTATTARAQIVSNGPYFALPAWDQIIPNSTRFISLSNMLGTAILDRETGLVWQTFPSTMPSNWYAATTSCQNYSAGGGGLGEQRRYGWRLPKLDELMSLMDDTQNPTIPNGNLENEPGEIFNGVQKAYYWTSTDSVIDANWVMVVYLGRPFLSGGPFSISSPKTSATVYTWCVRGPSR